MSGSYVNKAFDEETVVWTNQVASANALNFSSASLAESFNETYQTATEGNETQYLSILESPHDVTLEVLDNLTLSNSKIMENSIELNIEQDTGDLNIADSADQVVVFSVDGSDDLYGIQIVQDEMGNTQKYEFKFRQTEGGQLEAIPETIHLLINEEEVFEQEMFENQELLDKNNDQFQEDHASEGESSLQSNEMENSQKTLGLVKGEPTEEINYQQEQEENAEGQEHEDEDEQVDIDVKPAVLQLPESVANMKAELLKDHASDMQEIYQQDETEEQIVYQNESEIFEHEDSNEENHCNIQLEETLIQEDSNFYEENIEEVPAYETIHFSHNPMILEAQYISEKDEQEADEEYPQYESIYIQSTDSSEQTEEQVNHTEDTTTATNEECSHSNETEFQVVEGIHVTAEEEPVLEDLYQETAVPTTVLKQPAQKNNSNILKQQSILNTSKMPKKSKKVLCYVVPNPEKENVNSIPTMVPRNYRANPRSVLKQSAIDHSLAGSASQESLLKQKDHQPEKPKLDKRFAKSKDAIQAKLFNHFLSKTTIPHAPVRQQRLPRKQEIKPVDTRREEEIIVQEVMVSSNGFVESVEDRLKGKDKLEVVSYIDLSDSEDEHPKTNQKNSKNDGVIEILSSEDEADVPEPKISSKAPETPKKRRGRPRKSSDSSDSPPKESANDEGQDSADESSPSKKVRTETSEAENVTSKKQLSCPLCTKMFPSPNSLSTHMHHHNLENQMRKSHANTIEFKHKCPDCETTFKNALLLSRHCCAKKTKKIIIVHECIVCKKTFDSQMLLNVHKKTHDSAGPGNTFLKPTSCVRRLTLAKKPAEDTRMKETKAQSRPSLVSNAIKTPKIVERTEHVDGSSKYKCEKCQQGFKNGILLKKHVCPEVKSNRLKCGVCNLTFKDVSVSNIHKKKHIKENLFNVTSEVKISPMKYLPKGKRDLKNSPRKSFGHLKASNKGSPSFKTLKKFACTTCNARFASRVLLDIHTRKQCVKSPAKSRLSVARNATLANLTVMSSSPVDMQAECGTCSSKFKTFRMLLKHQITEHGYSPPDKEELMKPKKKPIGLKVHGGIRANPRLQKSFASIVSAVQSLTPIKPTDHKPERF